MILSSILMNSAVLFFFFGLLQFMFQLLTYCAGKVEECKSLFETLYKFVYLQGTYLKPHVRTQPFSD